MNVLSSLLALSGWGLWGYTVLFVEPEVPLAPLAFYAALFVALTCTLARVLGHQPPEPRRPGAAAPTDYRARALEGTGPVEGETGAPSSMPNLGHAAAVSTLLLFALWLQSLRMLTPLNGTLLATTFALIEVGFFLSRGRRKPRVRRRQRRATVPDAGLAPEPWRTEPGR